MFQRVTKCTVCGESGHTRICCLVICGSCNGDNRCCNCQQPQPKKRKTTRRRKEHTLPANPTKEPPQSTNSTTPPHQQPQNASTPITNYKSICRPVQQKNQCLGKAYQDLRAAFDALEEKNQEKDEQLQQAQKDTEEMAGFVRKAELRLANYRRKIQEKDEQIEALQVQLWELEDQPEPPVNQQAEAKVDRNDLEEIHRRYRAVLSVICERKCSLNNAYRLAGAARSSICDFLGIAELWIVNNITYKSTLERLGNPNLSIKTIKHECREQLCALLPTVKRLRHNKTLLPLAVEDTFYL